MVERKHIPKCVERIVTPLLILGVTALPHLVTLQPEVTSVKAPTLQATNIELIENNYLRQPLLMQTISGGDGSQIYLAGFRKTDFIIQGIAGHYSREGCIGCSEGLIMSNGEPLKNDELTLAAPLEIPLNAPVLIENIKNGRSAIAKVTDRGGFRDLGRIADLTPASKEAIGGDTDLMDVKITLLEPSDPTPDNP